MRFSESTLKAMESAMLALHNQGRYELTLRVIGERMLAEGSPYSASTLENYLRRASKEHPSIFTEVGSKGPAKLYANTKFLEETTNPEDNNVGRRNRPSVVETSLMEIAKAPEPTVPRVNVYSNDLKEAGFLKEFASVLGMNEPENLATYHSGLELQLAQILRRLDGLSSAQVSYAESRADMKVELGEVKKRYEAFANFVKANTDTTGRFKLEIVTNELNKKVEDFYVEFVEFHKQTVDSVADWAVRTRETAELAVKLHEKQKNAPASAPGGTFADGYGQGFEAGIKFAMDKLGNNSAMILQIG